MLCGIVAGLSFWAGGRALHEFVKFDRMLGEMMGIVLALVLGLIAVFLKGIAQRIEDQDNGESLSLAIDAGNEGDKPNP